MSRSKIPLLAAALMMCSGCPKIIDSGISNGPDVPFKLDFNPVSNVSVSGGGYADPGATSNAPNLPANPGPSPYPIASASPLPPPTADATILIGGQGALDDSGRVTFSLSFSESLDSSGCFALAEQAQQEGRQLLIEGVGSVLELADDQVEPVACIAEPIAADVPACEPCAEPQSNTASELCCPVQPPCWSSPPLSQYIITAHQLTACSLGDQVVLPPLPSPSPSEVAE